MTPPLLIHDGRELRPLTVSRDLGYQAEDLLADLDAERVLYPAEHELLERIAIVLGRPPARRAGIVLELSRDDAAVLGHALEVLGRLRRRRLDELGGRAPYVGEGADGARRSAQVVRDELATLAADDPRRPALEESAAAWERQAARLTAPRSLELEAEAEALGAPCTREDPCRSPCMGEVRGCPYVTPMRPRHGA